MAAVIKRKAASSPTLSKQARLGALSVLFLLCLCSTHFASIPQAIRTGTALTWDYSSANAGPKSNSKESDGRMKQVSQSTSRIVNIQPTLLDWEVNAIMSVNLSSTNFTTLGDVPYDDRSKLPIQGGVCEPPDSYNYALRGGRSRCCTGAISSGGSNTFTRSIGCAIGSDAYEQLRMAALETMNNGSLTLSVPATAGENEMEASFHSQCDVCRIVDIAMKNNYTVAFTGDSIQRQIWDGFVCELARSGYNLQYNGVHSRPQAFWGRGVSYYEEMEILLPSPADQQNSNKSSILMRFYQQYMPLEGNMTEIREISEWSDVLVFNFGVHYRWDRHEDKYRDEMTAVVNEFKQHSSSFALLAFRETCAQHYPNPGGEFIQERISHYLDCNLSPASPNTTDNNNNNDDDNIFGWRERIVNEVATNLTYRVLTSDGSLLTRGVGEDPAVPPPKNKHEDDIDNDVDDNKNDLLMILPFLNFTKSLGYLHRWQVGSQGPNDCTHFCVSPFLWMPLWRSLRISLEYKEQTTRSSSSSS